MHSVWFGTLKKCIESIGVCANGGQTAHSLSHWQWCLNQPKKNPGISFYTIIRQYYDISPEAMKMSPINDYYLCLAALHSYSRLFMRLFALSIRMHGILSQSIFFPRFLSLSLAHASRAFNVRMNAWTDNLKHRPTDAYDKHFRHSTKTKAK